MEYLTNKTHWILCLICTVTFIFSGQTYAAEVIGRVIYSTGAVQAINKGQTRTLKRGSRLYEGDTVRADLRTQSQLRMSDGALIAVRPGSELRFDQYRYDTKDQSKGSSIFSLIKGGFRTISGWIGKNNKKNYRVRTSVATIGIRGTHYGLTLCEQDSCNDESDEPLEDGLYGSVIDGEIIANNDAGSFTFANDEYFHIGSRNSRPNNLLRPPNVVFGQGKLVRLKKMQQQRRQITHMAQRRRMQQAAIFQNMVEQQRDLFQQRLTPVFEVANDTTGDSTLQFFPAEPGMLLGFSFFEPDPGSPLPIEHMATLKSDGTDANSFVLNANALADGIFIPVAARETTGFGTKDLFLADARVRDANSISIAGTRVGWGRWTNQYQAAINGNPLTTVGNLHYLVAERGTFIDLAKLTQLGGLYGSATYSVVGGTPATDLAGNIAGNLANINMNVNFLSQTIDTFSIATNVGGNLYSTQIMTAEPIINAVNNGLSLGPGTGCNPQCNGFAELTFIGPDAEGAATMYTITNSTTNNAVNGTAVLVNDSAVNATMAK